MSVDEVIAFGNSDVFEVLNEELVQRIELLIVVLCDLKFEFKFEPMKLSTRSNKELLMVGLICVATKKKPTDYRH